MEFMSTVAHLSGDVLHAFAFNGEGDPAALVAWLCGASRWAGWTYRLSLARLAALDERAHEKPERACRKESHKPELPVAQGHSYATPARLSAVFVISAAP